MKLSLLFQAAVLALETPLDRRSRDLISWNKLHNIAYQLRLKHVARDIERQMADEKPPHSYLDSIKAFLHEQKTRDITVTNTFGSANIKNYRRH